MDIQYYNDRKGEYQSHEISSTSNSIPVLRSASLYGASIDAGVGYGFNINEALKEYYRNIKALQKSINDYVSNMESGNFRLVDHEGNEVIEEIIDDYYSGDIRSETPVVEIIKQFTQDIKEDKKDE